MASPIACRVNSTEKNILRGSSKQKTGDSQANEEQKTNALL